MVDRAEPRCPPKLQHRRLHLLVEAGPCTEGRTARPAFAGCLPAVVIWQRERRIHGIVIVVGKFKRIGGRSLIQRRRTFKMKKKKKRKTKKRGKKRRKMGRKRRGKKTKRGMGEETCVHGISTVQM